MDKYIDGRFERVEKALATLIDSISKYNPSSSQANDLAIADKELSAGLEELQTHQNNYLRILDLRAATAALDEQIKATLSTLAATRRDITGTAITTYPDGAQYDISYEELLNYARRISRTTLPPPGVVNGIDLAADANTHIKDITQPGSAAETAGQTPASTAGGGVNGAATPGPGTAPGSQAPTTAPTPATGGVATAPPGGETPSAAAAAAAAATAASLGPTTAAITNALPQPLLARANNSAVPAGGALFYPWPAEDSLRSGSLALLQTLADSGVDARGYDPVEEEARRRTAEAERREAEEQRAREVEERERERATAAAQRAAREREAAAARQREREAGKAAGDAGAVESWRRGSVMMVPGDGGGDGVPAGGRAGGGAGGGGEKKQFQFLGDLDDDDEEDE